MRKAMGKRAQTTPSTSKKSPWSLIASANNLVIINRWVIPLLYQKEIFYLWFFVIFISNQLLVYHFISFYIRLKIEEHLVKFMGKKRKKGAFVFITILVLGGLGITGFILVSNRLANSEELYLVASWNNLKKSCQPKLFFLFVCVFVNHI